MLADPPHALMQLAAETAHHFFGLSDPAWRKLLTAGLSAPLPRSNAARDRP